MNYSIEIKGLDKLDKRLKDIASRLPAVPEKAVPQMIVQTKQQVIANAPVKSGDLRRSIQHEIVEEITAKGSEVRGRIYADMGIAPYALWVNYGTGIHAKGEGGSRAEKIPWFVPAGPYFGDNWADLSMYNKPTVTDSEGRKYYIMWGAQPTYFMTNAYKDKKRDNINIAIKEIKRALEGK